MLSANNDSPYEGTLIAAVLCGDDADTRRNAWAQLLVRRFRVVWLSSDGRYWKAFPDETAKAANLTAVDAVFFHDSDRRLDGELRGVTATQVFLFHESGTPKQRESYLPILRQAGDSIDLTQQDVDEIADYVAHPQLRMDIPSCCTPRSRDYLLPALAILCQGYLAAHACAGLWSNLPASAPVDSAYRRALLAMG